MALPRATFNKGDDLTFEQVQEFKRLKGKDGKGKFLFADQKAPAAKKKAAKE